MNEAAVHDAATADEASTSMRVLGNAHAPVAQDHDEGPQQSAVREYVDQPCCTNCIISTALAVILCRKRCDPSRVISEFAFFPPEPPTYSIAEGAKEATVEQPGVLSLAFNYRELEVDAHFARFKQLDGAAGRPTCRLLFTGRKPGQETGDSTSLRRGCSRTESQYESIHALSSSREMIARPKMSQVEWKTTEI